MNKRTFSNLLSKEKASFNASVAKFRKLNESSNISKSDNIPSTSRTAVSKFIFCDVSDNFKEATNFEIEEELEYGSDKEFLPESPSSDTINAKERDEGEMSEPNKNANTAMVLQQILDTLDRMESGQEEIIKRLSAVENALTEKMPERAEVQAQSQLLREFKVLSEKTHRSVSRITGDVVSEEHLLLLSLLPMSSEETVLKVEEHLTDKAHADAMAAIILNLKSTKKSIEKVLRSLFSDELIWLYNCDGKAGKRALTKLKIVDLTFAAFASMQIHKTSVIRRYVTLSHNRYKHIRRYVEKALTKKKPEGAEVQARRQLLRECKVPSGKTHRSVSRITGDVVDDEQLNVENALTEKKPESAEVQARSQLLQECKVPPVKTHRSVSRITGDVVDDEQLNVENALTEKKPENAEVQARSPLLRECKVPVKTHRSVSRITGDVVDEEQLNVELTEKMPEGAEVQAESQLLRECEVLSEKNHRSVSRITGYMVSEEQLLLLSLLPMSSEETVLKVEEHLTNKAYADAMVAIILNLKSIKGSIEMVLRSLFSDELIWLYNCDGKAGKRALTKLKIVGITLAAFPSMDINKTSIIRRYVALSHNRYKHIRRSIRRSDVFFDLSD
ncbi:PREDICTED: uncharacterized protein LOC108969346 isoform X1 [Bactrocera latifrons]|uniref:uncharacterized protein LOC108969346 isoform X1 n=1 Tax=Bactrocera latifrons TaxID=174628 RepID=UPI0008DCF0DE|nr:PREDICTED: uncharacterized protein LOC108969346 isoform X1 [Bactrocera latifrons]XP_018789538.1 PREDICTED: uncharacterized protein LOC108969346 isoform X1 [Bactrocera latifrons]XP_018789539.1 PREDICTED: uncharacterized protein LOC108969346 isoform X2 [Bactrocera latifrons]XP_018789540.1 PREDICTED: uncharacterized protein LOC108969346 isoform X1 [Bactrocera latifrons]